MLKSLQIKNIALIESLDIDFSKGLTILSGETGAGKSIIIDSINFVLGKKIDKSIIRYGSDKAVVSALFDCFNDSNTYKLLEEMDIDIEDNEILLKRSLDLDGKNVCTINGQKVNLTMLKQVALTLVDIYGQNETSQVLQPNSHLKILDEYAGKKIENIKNEQIKLYNEYKQCLKTLAQYGSISQVAQNVDLYEFQINEIESAELQEGEEEELIQKRHKMNNSQYIISSLSQAYECLDGDNDINIVSSLSSVKNNLNTVSNYDSSVDSLIERIENLQAEAKDISQEVEKIANDCEFDQEEYNAIEERLSLIRNLKKKYGASIEEINNFLQDVKSKYDFLTEGESKVAQLENDKIVLKQKLYDNSILLSNERKKIADDLSKKIEKELAQLGMKGAKFAAKFKEISPIDSILDIPLNGLDEMEFIFSANPGQPLKELNKIISGGELSRFMLALKSIIADLDDVSIMIFDEIDSGISGETAQVVAEKLYKISLNKQVLAITHLPQLASMADNNYLITKYTKDNVTKTTLEYLDGDNLYNEIARLIGGNKDSEYAILHAKEMKKHANSLK